MNAWAEHVLSIASERFERRLAEEISGLEMRLRKEMHEGFAAIRQEISDLRKELSGDMSDLRKEMADLRTQMAELRADLLKWSMLFWIGQFAAFTAVLSFMLRNR